MLFWTFGNARLKQMRLQVTFSHLFEAADFCKRIYVYINLYSHLSSLDSNKNNITNNNNTINVITKSQMTEYHAET